MRRRRHKFILLVYLLHYLSLFRTCTACRCCPRCIITGNTRYFCYVVFAYLRVLFDFARKSQVRPVDCVHTSCNFDSYFFVILLMSRFALKRTQKSQMYHSSF
uniref:Putative secreted protein n=1 Tax=Ixodes ricinus TaxID=34613 RepID=A0A6B0UFP2_IXORI